MVVGGEWEKGGERGRDRGGRVCKREEERERGRHRAQRLFRSLWRGRGRARKKAGRAQRLVRSLRVGEEEAGKGVRHRRDGRGGTGQRETTTFLVPVLGRGGLATKVDPAKGEIVAKVQRKIGES